MHQLLHNVFYSANDAWDEATRLVSWFGLPVLGYIALPLLALAAVICRQRTFKLTLAVTMLLAACTMLYWNDVGFDLLYFKLHYSGPAPAAPAHHDRSRSRFSI